MTTETRDDERRRIIHERTTPLDVGALEREVLLAEIKRARQERDECAFDLESAIQREADASRVVDAEYPPTIARAYLVAMAMRMRKAAQVLRRHRNAELARDLTDSAEVVEKFMHDTREKK